MKIVRFLFYVCGWIFVRPRRWFFRKIFLASFGTRWWFQKREYWNDKGYIYEWPNPHWRIMYLTVWRFFKWVYHDGWRPLCTWKNGWLYKKPLIAEIVHWVGRTTVGQHIMSQECWHCGFERGDQSELAEDETGKTFILEDSGMSQSQDGNSYWFTGTTICPVCGYRSEYHDGT